MLQLASALGAAAGCKACSAVAEDEVTVDLHHSFAGGEGYTVLRALEFSVLLVRQDGEKLGVDVDNNHGNTLIIERIHRGGLISTWNATYPEQRIRRRDAIVEVNGIREDIPLMIEQCSDSELLDLTIRRTPHKDKPLREVRHRPREELAPLDDPSWACCAREEEAEYIEAPEDMRTRINPRAYGYAPVSMYEVDPLAANVHDAFASSAPRDEEEEAEEEEEERQPTIATMPGEAPPEGTEYGVKLLRRDGGEQALGVNVDSSDGLTLLIEEVHPGLIADWNASHPDACVKVDDLIVEVNGVRGDVQGMVDECGKAKELHLVIRRAAGDVGQVND